MDPLDAGSGGILRQPKAVWATAGASVVAFMGIGRRNALTHEAEELEPRHAARDSVTVCAN